MDIQERNSDHSVLNSIKMKRIILPILIGIGVVIYMMVKQLDLNQFNAIEWNSRVLFWLLMAVGMYVARHLFYSLRLMVMSGREFSLKKSIELIFIWEFASAVSPTSIGGAGVALFLLAQEKLSGAKTVAVVLYSMVVDTIFFVVSLPILYLILGASIVRPGMESLQDLDGFGFTFLGVLAFMTLYGAIFFYGLFINPKAIKRLLLIISKIPFLGRFKRDLRSTAMDVVITSEEMQNKPKRFHIICMIYTFAAWITRFLAINCIILALVASVPATFWDQFLIFARGETMHTVTAFTPTPGGAGFAEYLFGGFFTDYIPEGIASLIALVWRVLTYYPYLIAGVIIIPIWIREVVNRKRQEQEEASQPDLG